MQKARLYMNKIFTPQIIQEIQEENKANLG